MSKESVQKRALRCAKSLPRNLLFHRWPDERKCLYRLPIRKTKLTLLDQMDACKSEEAQRLITGKSR